MAGDFVGDVAMATRRVRDGDFVGVDCWGLRRPREGEDALAERVDRDGVVAPPFGARRCIRGDFAGRVDSLPFPVTRLVTSRKRCRGV